jgi:hypothetical protein
VDADEDALDSAFADLAADDPDADGSDADGSDAVEVEEVGDDS